MSNTAKTEGMKKSQKGTSGDIWAQNRPVEELVNIGEKVSAALAKLGIVNEHDLRRKGAVDTFYAMVAMDKSWDNLMLLYALQGALLEMNCLAMPDDLKQVLKDQVRKTARK